MLLVESVCEIEHNGPVFGENSFAFGKEFFKFLNEFGVFGFLTNFPLNVVLSFFPVWWRSQDKVNG